MLSRMLAGLVLVSIGLITLFVFFAILGGVGVGEVIGIAIAVAVLALLVAGYELYVRREMQEGDSRVMRPIHRLRERRGF